MTKQVKTCSDGVSALLRLSGYRFLVAVYGISHSSLSFVKTPYISLYLSLGQCIARGGVLVGMIRPRTRYGIRMHAGTDTETAGRRSWET